MMFFLHFEVNGGSLKLLAKEPDKFIPENLKAKGVICVKRCYARILTD